MADKQKSKSKGIAIFLLLLAGIMTVYFWQIRDGNYLKSSLLEGQKSATAEEAEKWKAEGAVCRPDIYFKETDCKETKFGKLCDLRTKESKNFICTWPTENQEEENPFILDKDAGRNI